VAKGVHFGEWAFFVAKAPGTLADVSLTHWDGTEARIQLYFTVYDFRNGADVYSNSVQNNLTEPERDSTDAV
jgi:hypothetical protein